MQNEKKQQRQRQMIKTVELLINVMDEPSYEDKERTEQDDDDEEEEEYIAYL